MNCLLGVRYSSVSLSPTFGRNEKVEQHIRKKIRKPNALRFWVEGGVIPLYGFGSCLILVRSPRFPPRILPIISFLACSGIIILVAKFKLIKLILFPLLNRLISLNLSLTCNINFLSKSTFNKHVEILDSGPIDHGCSFLLDFSSYNHIKPILIELPNGYTILSNYFGVVHFHKKNLSY